MDKNATIVVTGAAGFIGSCLTGFLNQNGFNELILVDDFSRKDKEANLAGKHFINKIERTNFFEWVEKEQANIQFVFHLGARTDTTEFDYTVHERLNVEYSKDMWGYCSKNQIPLVYASSAATYGDGSQGYNDDHSLINSLDPLNPYGVSKNEFDKWVLQQTASVNAQPPFWAGLKFFNVYGPNEYHKGRMASVIFHSFNQIQSNGFVKLFKSHKEGFRDGEQLRDFIYVKDVVDVCAWLMENYESGPGSAIYNLGTGEARTFTDLVKATFQGLELEPDIRFIDMPEDLRETYQYFTEAEMTKLRKSGYAKKFYSLEDGVGDYVRSYLSKSRTY